MKTPFSLSKYKTGSELVNEHNFPARIICTNAKRKLSIITLVSLPTGKEEIYAYNKEGVGADSSTRLFFKEPIKDFYCTDCFYGNKKKDRHNISGYAIACKFLPDSASLLAPFNKACEKFKSKNL